MAIDLTEKELRVLIEILDERLRELRSEIVHTSTREFKTTLKDRERVLQCLHDKLITQDALRVA